MSSPNEMQSALMRAVEAMPSPLKSQVAHLRDLLAESKGETLAALFTRANQAEGELLEAAAWLWAQTLQTPVSVEQLDSLEVAEGEVRLVPGKLQVAKDVLNRGILVIAGDVQVGGEFGDGDVGNAAVIAGSLRCQVANAQGVLRVRGALEASQLVFASNDPEPLVARGGLRAPLTILQLGRSLDVKAVDGLVVEDEVTPAQFAALKQLLPASVLLDVELEDEDEDDDDDVSVPLDEVLDMDALYAAAQEGALIPQHR